MALFEKLNLRGALRLCGVIGILAVMTSGGVIGGVGSPYSPTTPAEMYPGEEREAYLTLFNTDDKYLEGITVLASVSLGSEFVSLDKESYFVPYFIPGETENTYAKMTLKIPHSAPLGDEYLILCDFRKIGKIPFEIHIIPNPNNQPPVADAGEDQRVAAGDVVTLDGNASSDPDDDPLTYQWTFVSVPVGSGAVIAEPTEVQTMFIPDLPGDHMVSLVVNDGTEDSEPDTVTITAIPPEQAAQETLEETEEVIGDIRPEDFHNKNSGKALTNKLEAALTMIAEGSYEEALEKLQNDILKKTDGCAETGEPDKNDWIEDCDAQAEVYPLLMWAIELLLRLVE